MIRIQSIASMVKQGMILADIGTDHAFLPIMLIKQGIRPKAYACDITKGPLSIAKTNIARENLEDRIIPVCSDGFEHVPQDAQCAVIAGMGCDTIISILERGMDHIMKMEQIIVEANNDPEKMRRWISDHGFTIEDERVVHERRHDYVIISFNTAKHAPYSEEDVILGPVLKKRNEQAFQDYCTHQVEKLTMILSHRQDEQLLKRRQYFAKYANREM